MTTKNEQEFPIHPKDLREIPDPDALIDVGEWVLIVRKVPVQYGPKTYGIYWALPHRGKERIGIDKYGRQCAMVYTPKEVKVFPDEYRILSQEKLEEYRKSGWEISLIEGTKEQPLDTHIIEKGKNLTEEEREVIWSLMLDGLSEQQACEEYFLTRHSQNENIAFSYQPPESMRKELCRIFGE